MYSWEADVILGSLFKAQSRTVPIVPWKLLTQAVSSDAHVYKM